MKKIAQIRCQLLNICDYTHMASEKFPHQYGVTYRYRDACTHLGILRIYVLNMHIGIIITSFVNRRF